MTVDTLIFPNLVLKLEFFAINNELKAVKGIQLTQDFRKLFVEHLYIDCLKLDVLFK